MSWTMSWDWSRTSAKAELMHSGGVVSRVLDWQPWKPVKHILAMSRLNFAMAGSFIFSCLLNSADDEEIDYWSSRSHHYREMLGTCSRSFETTKVATARMEILAKASLGGGMHQMGWEEEAVLGQLRSNVNWIMAPSVYHIQENSGVGKGSIRKKPPWLHSPTVVWPMLFPFNF